MWKRSLGLALGLILVSASSAVAFWFIRDMYDQISIKPQEEARPMPKDSVPVGGYAVPRGYNYLTLETVLTPPALTPEMAAKGKVLYGKFCEPCHGTKGLGDGPVALKGMRPWWPLGSPQTQARSDGYIFAHIWEGGPLMAPYKYALSVTEAWELVAYVRELGRSQ